MRTTIRRLTRLTNGFSKKIENLEHAVALHFMHYNFGRIHKTLRVTPAMAAGVADHVWTLQEIAGLAARHNWGLRELRLEVGSLEEFFIQITAEARASGKSTPV